MALSHLKGLFRLEDKAFTQLVSHKDSVRDALSVLLVVLLVSSSLKYLIEVLVLAPFLTDFLALFDIPFEVPVLSAQGLVVAVAAALLFGIIGTVLWALLTIWCARMLGAQKGSARELFAVFGHSHAIRIVSFIPILGLVTWVYSVIINIKGVSVLTGLSTGRSLFAYVLPLLIFGALGLVFGIIAVALLAVSGVL